MEQPGHSASRKRFLMWGAALLSTLTVLKFIRGTKSNTGRAPGTIKMLSQDGKLVEIDKNLLASNGKKISSEELQKWIKK